MMAWLAGCTAMHGFFHEMRAQLVLLAVIGVIWCVTTIDVY